MSPALILFGASLGGAFAGFLMGIAVKLWLLAAVIAGFICLACPYRKMRALLLVVLTFSIAAVLAKHRLGIFEKAIAQIPGQYSEMPGVVEEVSPTLNEGVRIRFLADGGYRLKVYLKEGAAIISVHSGDRVKIFGQVKRLHHALALGDFDAYWLGLARGFHGQLSIHSPFRIKVIKSSPFRPGIRENLRNRLTHALSPRQASVLLALMVGETDLFEREQKDLYTNVGAGHLLAVSGLQISCLSFVFFFLFRALLLLIPWVGRRSFAGRPAALLTLVAIWGFTSLSGNSPSAVRAALMGSVVSFGIVLGREAKLLEAFGVAGFLSVLMAPESVFDPSFLFSYLAIFGLAVSGSILAGLVTLPLSLYYFGAVALGGIFANLLLMPISVFLQTPAIFLATIGLYQPAAMFAGALEALCEMLGDYLGGLWWFAPPNAWQVVGLMVAMILFAKKYRINAVVLSALLFLPAHIGNPPGVRITVLPVGQGDSSVFEFPNGQVMIVDGGPREEYLLKYLRQRHIRTIDTVVLSHPDADHLIGLLRVLEEIPVRELWHSGFSRKNELMKQLLELAADKQVQVKIVADLLGDHQFGGAIVSVLAPSQFDEHQSTNNNSLVFKVSYGAQSALWPGDIETEGELRATPQWYANVVKAPHHGSRSSSSSHFIKNVRPEQVIFCTAPGNQFKFPHGEVIARWRRAGANTLDVAKNGVMQVFLTGSSVIIKPFLVSN